MALKSLRKKLKRVFQPQSSAKNVAELEGKVKELETRLEQFVSLARMKGAVPPIPPKHLQVRVAGAYYPTFFEHGKRMFHDLEALLQSQGQSFSGFENILDFGCGCGRFLIPMSFLLPPGKFSGTDIDQEAIGWLRENYPAFRDLDVNQFQPPTKYAAATFDFVYSVSIFTHLPEAMEESWLAELARIIKPGGYGLFTTHGANYVHLLTAAERAELTAKGFCYRVGQPTDGLPEFYQTSFHTVAYIREKWARHFEVLAVREKGLDGAQDAVLVRKKS
jgi:SAM-dependent methyltransferase